MLREPNPKAIEDSYWERTLKVDFKRLEGIANTILTEYLIQKRPVEATLNSAHLYCADVEKVETKDRKFVRIVVSECSPEGNDEFFRWVKAKFFDDYLLMVEVTGEW